MFKALFKGSSKAANQLSIEGTNFRTSMKPNQSVLTAAVDARFKVPNYCGVGECGTCRCRVMDGRVRLTRDITNHISLEEIEQGYVLACQTIAESDLVIRVPGLSPEDDSLVTSSATISALIPLTHDIFEVQVALERPLAYIAGQYAQLSVPAEPQLAETPRNYSFASAPGVGNANSASFYIRHVPGGLFTDWLFAADRTGARLTVTGPYGDFRYRKTERPLLCVAGGSGLAPIKALLEQLRSEGISRQVIFLFGARQQRDLYCLDEIAEMAAAWPVSFAFHPVLSHEPVNSNWTGRRGLVTDHVVQVVPNYADHDAYLCGPPPMVDAVIAKVKGHIPADRLHFDKFLDQSALHPTTNAQDLVAT